MSRLFSDHEYKSHISSPRESFHIGFAMIEIIEILIPE
jgi:hypothetical protein